MMQGDYPNEHLRVAIRDDVETFLRKGGRIQQVPAEASGEMFNPNRGRVQMVDDLKRAGTREIEHRKERKNHV